MEWHMHFTRLFWRERECEVGSVILASGCCLHVDYGYEKLRTIYTAMHRIMHLHLSKSAR